MINREVLSNNMFPAVKPPLLHPRAFVRRGESGGHDECGEVSCYQLSPIFLSLYYASFEPDMNIE